MVKIYSFDELTDSVELLERKPPRFIAILLSFLFLCLLVFAIWAYVGKVDIVSKGTAIVEGKSNSSTIRTQIVGIVDTISVQSGDEVKKGETLIQLKNQELTGKQNQLNNVIKHVEEQKAMLEQLKQSIKSEKAIFSKDLDQKIRDEYKAYEQGYQALEKEQDNEIKSLMNNKLPNEQDEVLQGLLAEKENIQRELKFTQKQKEKTTSEQIDSINERIQSLEAQQTNVEKRVEQRKVTLENERSKIESVKEGKQEQKKFTLRKYKEDAIVSINQRIQSVDEELFVKKQEMESLHHQGETTVIKAPNDGVIQFTSILQKGDLVEPGQELISIIPKENIKKIKILMSAQEVKGIKKGDKAQYSFKLKKTDKQVGIVTYISAHPIFDKDSKTYMYEMEASIDTNEFDELHMGMVGRVSVVTGEESIWRFILRELDFISN
ncbi:HlyD family efflux transporter periplasmic adaptor subunit [Bacillus cereus]|uniref:HlyD family efflux transporter periplasmic adaptor subunit n=1 Tax=Bacillus cereus TaxID=1396 RepID=UPI000BF2F6EE|nr:HlyD family efflux transporter periplasmic adaptor subunit [Bacillus cereus]PFD11060.1 hemolysin D [Bacillus cereus]